jgi:hypothetical protein
MHTRRSSLRPCSNPGSTLAPRIPIRRTRLGTHLERRRRANFQTRSPVRGAPGFKVQLDRRGRTVGVGHRGEISAALEFNQASLARFQRRCPGRKRRPRTPCPGPTLRVPPSSSRESHCSPKWFMVARRGRQNGTKFNSTECCSKNTAGVERPCDGFPPRHWFPPYGTRSPGVPPSPGLLCCVDLWREWQLDSQPTGKPR